jgi:hypothetical protein
MRKIINNRVRQLAGRLLFVIIIAGGGLASCTYYENDYNPLVVPDDLGFDEHIIPIFEERCNNAGCHSGAIPPDLQRDVAYRNLIQGDYVSLDGDAEGSLLYQKIDGGSMEAFATDLDRTYIKAWIEDGAQDN